jgi:hypothetical protein
MPLVARLYYWQAHLVERRCFAEERLINPDFGFPAPSSKIPLVVCLHGRQHGRKSMNRRTRCDWFIVENRCYGRDQHVDGFADVLPLFNT